MWRMTPDQAQAATGTHLLTTGEAAARLGVSSNTLRRWADDRRIKHVRLPSGRLRFRPGDLDEALAVQPADSPVGAA